MYLAAERTGYGSYLLAVLRCVLSQASNIWQRLGEETTMDRIMFGVSIVITSPFLLLWLSCWLFWVMVGYAYIPDIDLTDREAREGRGVRANSEQKDKRKVW